MTPVPQNEQCGESDLYSDFFHNCPVGMLRTRLDGTIELANGAFAAMLGYRNLEEFFQKVGKNIIDLYQNPEERSAILETLLNQSAPKSLEFNWLKKDRSPIVCRMQVRTILDNRGKPAFFHGFVQDITGQRKTEKQLAESDERYRAIFENTGTGTIIIENDTTISLANSGFVNLTGYSREEIEGKMSWTVLIAHQHDLERMLAYHRKRREQGGEAPIEYEFTLKNRQGELRDVFLRVDMIPGSGSSVASLLDITERKRMELALQQREAILEKENSRLRKTIGDSYRFGSLIGKSQPMQEVYRFILQAAASDAGVIIYGESGTGKELAAREIHRLSERNGRTFLPVNCGALPPSLFESELFGHRRGGFTGADRDKPGYLSRADGGTLFLDEIGEIGEELQVKLLRVLEGHGFTPVGGSRPIHTDVRFISATNRNLRTLIDEGRLREDFFYRIHILPITMPPLRKRTEDIPLLVEHFLEKQNSRVTTLPGQLMDRLLTYHWPGNVRELENTLQRYIDLGILEFAHGEDHPGEAATVFPDHTKKPSLPLKRATRDFEKSYILHQLEKNRWNRNRTAKSLGIERKTLYLKMKRFGLLG